MARAPFMVRSRYNARGWVLTLCRECGKLRYCEPHGTTAACSCSDEWTESLSISYEYGDGTVVLSRRTIRTIVSLAEYARKGEPA